MRDLRIRPVAGRILDLYAVVQPEGGKRLLGRPEFKAMFAEDILDTLIGLGRD